MLYFYLNRTNQKKEKFEIGIIEEYFLHEVSKKENIKFYLNSCSTDPVFLNYPDIYNGKFKLFIMIDYENSKFSKNDIIALMKKCHSIKIPKLDKSLEEFGLHYEFVIEISNKEINYAWQDYLAENNLSLYSESVAPPDMTLKEKITTITKELFNIGSENQTLTIIDAYIFTSNHDENYLELFISIIKNSKITSLEIVTNRKKKYNKDLFKEFKKNLSIPIYIYFSEEIHDRIWFLEKKKVGLLFGGSLNGYGKGSSSTIATLSEKDIEYHIKFVEKLKKR